jgi:hypothetical protein
MAKANAELRPQSFLDKPLYSFTDLEEPGMNVREAALIVEQLVQGSNAPGLEYAVYHLCDNIRVMMDLIQARFEQARVSI